MSILHHSEQKKYFTPRRGFRTFDSEDKKYVIDTYKLWLLWSNDPRHLGTVFSDLSSQHMQSLLALRAKKADAQPSAVKSLTKSEALDRWIKATKWGQPCENMFNHLAVVNPSLLCDIITSYPMHPVDLADAAYALEKADGNSTVGIVLSSLLNHEKPYVREAAVHGLSNKTGSSFVMNALRKALEKEDIQEIRDDISEII